MAGMVLSLAPNLEAAGIARRRVQGLLAATSEDQLDRVLLATSEVVTNAVLHGRGAVVVEVHTGPGVLRVEVTDQGGSMPRIRRDATSHDVQGRGLHIVETLVSRWGVNPAPTGPGKTVWFEIDNP